MSEAVLGPLPARPRSTRGLRFASDARLARLAREGEQRAFTAIYERHYDGLYRYCLAILHDRDDASDALQGAMMKALLAIPAKKPEVPLRPWLYRIAHNEAVTVRRRRSAHAHLDQVTLPAGRATDDLAFERDELKMIVDDLLALPERQRSALVMRELNGLEYVDIAASLGTTAGAAKQTVYEARVALYERAEGRRMSCARVRMAVSGGDRRVLRGRRISAHLRSCVECREFERAIAERGEALAALAPPTGGLGLAGLFKALLGGGASSGSGGSGGSGGLLAGLSSGGSTTVGSAAALKSAAALAVVVIASAGPPIVRGVSAGSGDSGGGPSRAAAPAPAAAIDAPRLAPSPPLLLAENPHVRLRPHARAPSEQGDGERAAVVRGGATKLAPGPAAASPASPPPAAPAGPPTTAPSAPLPSPSLPQPSGDSPAPSLPAAPDPSELDPPPSVPPPVDTTPLPDDAVPSAPLPDPADPGDTVQGTTGTVTGTVDDALDSTGLGE